MWTIAITSAVTALVIAIGAKVVTWTAPLRAGLSAGRALKNAKALITKAEADAQALVAARKLVAAQPTPTGPSGTTGPFGVSGPTGA